MNNRRIIIYNKEYILKSSRNCDDGMAPGIAEPRESPSAIINHEIGTIHGNSGAD